MKNTLAFFLLIAFSCPSQENDSVMVRRIYDHFLTQSDCYSNLEFLATKIGHRLSGSPQAAAAVEWTKKAMYAAGADTVFLQPCTVPRWERGTPEKCRLRAGGRSVNLNCVALGSSEATPAKGLEAGVVEVSGFDQLAELGEKRITGKIVFFNVFFDQRHVVTGKAYSEAVKYRASGASFAAKYGAVAVLIRSMTSVADDVPHTGNMIYDTTVSAARIPAVALGYASATLLHEALQKDPATLVYLKTDCRNLDPVISYNVVGQINGTSEPETIILAGGHLDSWDLGQGAHDDGAGIVQSIGVLEAIRKCNIRPLRTIRAVAFMNEENGLAGGSAYAAYAKEKNERHLAAIESDAGGFVPRGFVADTANGLFRTVSSFSSLYKPYLVDHFEKEGGGADLIELEKTGVPCIGFVPDMQRYFDIHHTAEDTFDKINKRELELGAAAITTMVFLLDRRYRGE